MIYNYVTNNNESEVSIECETIIAISDNDAILVNEGKIAGKKEDKIMIYVDDGETDRNFSKNNAYIKVYDSTKSKVIRLNLADNKYQKHSGSGKPWLENGLRQSVLDEVNRLLAKETVDKNYKGQTAYMAAVKHYEDMHHIKLGLTDKDRPTYKLSTLTQSKSERTKNEKGETDE